MRYVEAKGERAFAFASGREGCWVAGMNVSAFFRVQHDRHDGQRHYVVHTQDPKFSMELVPDGAAPDQIGAGVIKRVSLPNSWAGDYGKYSKLIVAAQEFFVRSLAAPAEKSETRRFGR